jgi:transcriptional regulator with XRE-family HTH domain
MEHEMKISAALVRRLRTERGWSQDQLATAAGLSLRTIQRIEAEGVASMATRVSLAATFSIPLAQLGAAEALAPAPSASPLPRQFTGLLLGLAVLSCGLLGESLRMSSVIFVPGNAAVMLSSFALAVNLLLAAVGTALVAPAAWQLLRERRWMNVALAALGMPLATLLVGGLLFALLRERTPSWTLLALGSGGVALVAMAWRDFARTQRG